MQTRIPFGKDKTSLIDRLGVYLSLRAIKKYLPKKNNLDILDLGCGYKATLLTTLQPHIKKGFGIDFSIDPHLKKHSALVFFESSIESAISQLSSQTMDAILFISALEHIINPLPILKECYRLLKQDGVLLINVPTWRGKLFLEFSAFKLGTSPKAEMDDHKMYYDKRDLWPLLIQAGFKPSQIKLRYHKFGLNLFAVISR